MKEIIKSAICLVIGNYRWIRLSLLYQKIKGGENYSKYHQILSFYSKFVKSDDLVFDVGANIGNRIIPLLEIGARVVAVEPQVECINVLRKNFGKRIQLIEKGLGESNEERVFYKSRNSTVSSFSKEWVDQVRETRFSNIEWEEGDSIQMTTLDALITRFGTPSFLKIDVEGYELEVLNGLTHAIKMISFEYTVPEFSDRILLCLKRVQESNKHIEINYSKMESMVFSLSKWLTLNEFQQVLSSREFLDSEYGDIYVRNANVAV